MQITSTASAQSGSQSVLKAANQQPHLAADLINRTIESLMQAQNMQTPAQPVAPPAGSVSGATINITA